MNIISKFQLSSSSGLGLTVFWIYFHKPWLSQWVNHEAVYRTAPATPGLLISFRLEHIIFWCCDTGNWSSLLRGNTLTKYHLMFYVLFSPPPFPLFYHSLSKPLSNRHVVWGFCNTFLISPIIHFCLMQFSVLFYLMFSIFLVCIKVHSTIRYSVIYGLICQNKTTIYLFFEYLFSIF